MMHPVTLTLALGASLLAAAAGAQALPNQSAATTTPTNVARVYVQTAKGVNVYTTSSTGKLTLVSGSPFKNTVGLMIGAPGGHFITLGTTYLRSYAIKPTGGIGAQVAQINTSLYQVRRNAALPLPMGARSTALAPRLTSDWMGQRPVTVADL